MIDLVVIFILFIITIYLMKVIPETRSAHYVFITITGSISLLADY